MAYCTTQDVVDEFKKLDIATAGAAVTAATLTEWIDQESDYIDSKVSMRYIVPIVESTYPQAFNVLRRIAIFRASERVKNKLEVKTNVSQVDSEVKYINNFIRTPNHDLEMISEGKLPLLNVPLLNTNGALSYATCNDGACAPTFNTCRQQW